MSCSRTIWTPFGRHTCANRGSLDSTRTPAVSKCGGLGPRATRRRRGAEEARRTGGNSSVKPKRIRLRVLACQLESVSGPRRAVSRRLTDPESTESIPPVARSGRPCTRPSFARWRDPQSGWSRCWNRRPPAAMRYSRAGRNVAPVRRSRIPHPLRRDASHALATRTRESPLHRMHAVHTPQTSSLL